MSARARGTSLCTGGGLTLARLAFARAWPLAAALASAALLLLARQHELARVEALPPDAAVPAAAALRSALWTLGFVLGVPALTFHAAGTFARWRRGELDFLAPRAAPRWSIVGATWLGHVAAVGALALGIGLACELGLPDGPSAQPRRVRDWPDAAWVSQAAPWRTTVDLAPQPEGTRLELGLVLGSGSGTATEVVLRARRAGAASATPGDSTESRLRLGTRGALEVEIPPGSAPLELELTLTDPAARVRLAADSGRVWTPRDGARGASVELALRLLLLGALTTALALGAGAFLARGLAAGLVLALWLVPDLAGADPSWIPARDAFEALELAGRGRVPSALPLAAWFGTALGALAALAPAALSAAAWRRTR